MNAAAVTLTLLLAATSPATSDIEVLGKGELSATAAEEIRNAARAARIQIVAIESISSEVGSLLFGYGPATRTRNGMCRGAVYGLELKDVTGASASRLIPLDESSAMPMTYALVAAQCRRSLVSRILVVGNTTDDELADMLAAIGKRRIAKDGTGRREDVRIAKELTVSGIENPGDGTAVVLMTDPADEENTLTVVLVNLGERWLISDTRDEP